MARPIPLIRRLTVLALSAAVVGVTFVPLDADARAGRGGGFGSRGSKTYSQPPSTNTAPGAAPIQRSTTQPGQPGAAASPGLAAGAQQRRPGFFGGGLGAGLMGGLLGAGLFGLLSGAGLFGGLGSLASIFGLLLQVGLIALVVMLGLRWWRSRQQGGATPAYKGPQPAYQSANPQPAATGPQPGGFRFDGFGRGGGGAARVETPVAPLTLEADDFDGFERLLGDVQAAWSAQDLAKLRTLATPEMVEGFADDLARDTSRGVVNRVSDVKLLQGDLSESWREGERAYATVAMRYELTDVTEDATTGEVVEGDRHTKAEATELWTFLRVGDRGRWLLSAIQQAA